MPDPSPIEICRHGPTDAIWLSSTRPCHEGLQTINTCLFQLHSSVSPSSSTPCLPLLFPLSQPQFSMVPRTSASSNVPCGLPSRTSVKLTSSQLVSVAQIVGLFVYLHSSCSQNILFSALLYARS